MAVSKAKKFKVIQNPELMRVGRAFVPTFGSDQDIAIINRMVKLEKLLPTVDNEIMRQGDPKKLTSKMKQILREERYLIDSITGRNNDF